MTKKEVLETAQGRFKKAKALYNMRLDFAQASNQDWYLSESKKELEFWSEILEVLKKVDKPDAKSL